MVFKAFILILIRSGSGTNLVEQMPTFSTKIPVNAMFLPLDAQDVTLGRLVEILGFGC